MSNTISVLILSLATGIRNVMSLRVVNTFSEPFLWRTPIKKEKSDPAIERDNEHDLFDLISDHRTLDSKLLQQWEHYVLDMHRNQIRILSSTVTSSSNVGNKFSIMSYFSTFKLLSKGSINLSHQTLREQERWRWIVNI